MKMKTPKTAFYFSVVLILTLGIFLAGCTSSTPASDITPAATTVPATETAVPLATPVETTLAQVTVQETTIPAAATTTSAQYKTYTNAQYGITMSYPKNWDVEESGTVAMRDYGKTTTNVVNFYSPGKDTYVIFSVDVDPSATTDLESYYNKAVLALQAYYPHWEMTKHSASTKVSDTNAYRVDYRVTHDDTSKIDYGVQVYTIVKETPFILTYQGNGLLPENDIFASNLDEAQDMIKSVKIEAVTATTKSR